MRTAVSCAPLERYRGKEKYILRQLPFRGAPQETVGFEIVYTWDPRLPGAIEILFMNANEVFLREILESFTEKSSTFTKPFELNELVESVIRNMEYSERLYRQSINLQTQNSNTVLEGKLDIINPQNHPVRKIRKYK